MKPRGITAGLSLVALVLGTWLLLSKPEPGISIRFTGYVTSPQFGMSYDQPRANVSARRAQFILSNDCDFPMICSLGVVYTNHSFGRFSPGEVTLDSHQITNIIGMVSAPVSKMQGRAVWLGPADWTNAWRLTVGVADPRPMKGAGAWRYRLALGLSQQKCFTLARWINPRMVRQFESELISPDAHPAL